MNDHPWFEFCIKEIDQAIKRGKRPWNSELADFATIKKRVEAGIGLTDRQERELVKLHQKLTELPRIKW